MIEKNSMESTLVASCHLVGGNQMLRVLICDDDSEMLRKLKDEVENIFHSLETKVKIHVFSDASQISDQILSSCDIALLDIDFEHKSYNGMDVARRLRGVRKDAVIIFVTNFIEYAPEGYEVQAFRYILKKDLETDLRGYILQALEHLQSTKETLKIQVNGEIIDLLLDNTLYFEVQQHNVTVYVQKDPSGKHIKAYSFYASLSELEQRLEPQGFLRIHKSYLVNMKHLMKFQCREAMLDNGTILRVGEKSYAEKKKQYLLWKGWK